MATAVINDRYIVTYYSQCLITMHDPQTQSMYVSREDAAYYCENVKPVVLIQKFFSEQAGYSLNCNGYANISFGVVDVLESDFGSDVEFIPTYPMPMDPVTVRFRFRWNVGKDAFEKLSGMRFLRISQEQFLAKK